MLETFADALSSLFFPQRCAVCRKRPTTLAGGSACDECWADTAIFNGQEMLCSKCGAYFGPEGIKIPRSCYKCIDHAYARAFASGLYEKALAAELLSLKTVPDPAPRLRGLIRDTVLNGSASDIDLVVPAPLSRQRRAERGFNQADIIASLAARSLRVDVDLKSLVRTRHTIPHRTGMDKIARERSVEGAFAVTRPNLIAGRTILLVDDIFTSGSTASACADALLKSKAARIDVFTVARAAIKY